MCDIEAEEDKEDEKDDDGEEKEYLRSLVSNEDTEKYHSECTDKVADEVNEGGLLEEYLQNLTSIPNGQTMKE